MKNYNILSANLVNSTLDFNEYNGEQLDQIVFTDSIKVKNIDSNKITLLLNRKILFIPNKNISLEASYEVDLRADQIVGQDELINDIKNNIMILNTVYAKLSLILSDLTNHSVFGPLVTPPAYNPKDINIEM